MQNPSCCLTSLFYSTVELTNKLTHQRVNRN